MCRFILACSLLAALSTIAQADRAYEPASVPQPQARFAQPPNAARRLLPPQIESNPVDPPAFTLDRDSVRAALLAARATNLADFRVYQKTGVFPSNTYKESELNVWRDAAGHYCAAATLILMSGQEDLVKRTAEQSNFIRLANVMQGPLMDWILTSGFTQNEIDAIQKPFMPVGRPTLKPSADPVVATVDPKLRAAEDARLRAKYASVDKMLVKNERKSLELAVDRLMKHQQLAWQLVARSVKT